MGSRISHNIFTIIILLLFVATSTYAATYHDHQHVSSAFAEGEKLIRGLNLSPKQAINIVNRSSLLESKAPNIVELFDFPNLVGNDTSVKYLGHHAGYYKLPHSKAARLFYFFFESRYSTKDPVVIWLNGGPGCSSSTGLFFENGPFKITKNLSLVWNDYGWDKASNILYVDQPTGTGFSYSFDKSDFRHDGEGVSNDLYDFIQEFFVGHPKFAKNDFFITGESYAGHYIPALASRIHKGNKAKEGIHVNLKGFAIGNGLTNPEIQYKAYGEYALKNKLIDKSSYDQVQHMIPNCEASIKACAAKGGEECESSFHSCNNIFGYILDIAGNINYYDIRKKCEGELCYDMSELERFFNLKLVRKALGVEDIEFVTCSKRVYQAMITDWMRNYEVGIPALLDDGIRVLIYAGEEDLICNWIGNSWWVHNMTWSGQKQFQTAKPVPFVVDSAQAGLLKSHGPLAFLKVHEAGHMVPMDQPKASLEMLKSFMKGTLPAS